jgi:lysozyme family protein
VSLELQSKMANFQAALDITLEHEGGFFYNKETGEIVNFGITQRFLIKLRLPSTIEDVRNLTKERATELYKQYFWDANRIGEISDQDLANKVFDLAVNMGREANVHTGIEGVILLQRALDYMAPLTGLHLSIDGEMGPATLAAANKASAPILMENLRTFAAERYREIAAADPHKTNELDGWLKRLAS